MSEEQQDQENIIEEIPTLKEDGLRVWHEKEIEVPNPRIIKRLTARNLLAELAAAFNLNRGFIYTLKGLTLRPAKTIKAYLDTGRYEITSPIKYFIAIVGFTLFIASLNNFFELNQEFLNGIEQGIKTSSERHQTTEKAAHYIKDIEAAYYDYFIGYQNVWSIFTIFFSSIFSYLFFKKSGYNLVEHFVVNAYIFIHSYLAFSLIVIFHLVNPGWLMLYFMIFLFMTLIVYKRLFLEGWGATIYKTIFTSILSSIVFYLLMFIALLIIVFQAKYNIG